MTPTIRQLGAFAVNVAIVLLLAAAAWQVVPDAVQGVAAKRQKAPPLRGATLMVVFQPKDCESYLSFIADWRRLESDSVNVIGIPIGVEDSEQLTSLLRNFPVTYPVFTDLSPYALRVMRQFDSLETPAAILVDKQNRPRMILSGSRVENQIDAQKVISLYLQTAMKEN